MASRRKDIVLRFGIVYAVICLAFIGVLYRIFVIQVLERKEWLKLADQTKKTEIIVRPTRGNIYACDGRLMASSIPTYDISMDMRVPALHIDNGKLFKENIDSVCYMLSVFFKEKTPYEYNQMLWKAYREGSSCLQLVSRRISFMQLKQLKQMPLFRLGKIKSGLVTKEFVKRIRPFGSLAARTIGDIYADELKGGKNGLELYFNKELIGIPGLSTRQKVANTYMETVQKEPVDGMDINTTIDIEMQDICEKALVDSLKAFDASTGYAILMETKTGEVKAIVNMQQNPDKTYSENRNGAVSDQVEPGSTFKVISLMAALDDGKANINDRVETGNGTCVFANRVMKDHNANHGGFGTITVAQSIHGSSNVGISKTIVKAYGNDPSAFVDKLYAMKLNEKLNIEIPGVAAPIIRHPKDKGSYWSSTTLPWMSIGYEVQIPPIYTLAYYNAIANNGKYIRPFFVRSISKNGQIIKKFDAEIINEQICKPSTLRDIKSTLLGVIEGEKGTAQNVKSKYFRIAGKTGTAQISKGAKGYKEGGTASHQVSFCGFFPADNPQYTAIVVIREPHKGYPSGGKMAGSIFKNIAEQVMAMKSNTEIADTLLHPKIKRQSIPIIKSGYYGALNYVMTNLNDSIPANKTNWVTVASDTNKLDIKPLSVPQNALPNLFGMGAKDAVYLAERLGLSVQMLGRGKVVSQNLLHGKVYQPGTKLIIQLK